LLVIAITIAFFGAFTNLIFVLRWNIALGIDDMIFVIFTSLVTSSLNYAFQIIPPLVALAKMTPKHVEATMFAFSNTVIIGGKEFGGRTMGVIINEFFNVESDNLEELYKLIIVQMILCLTPLLFLYLIPTAA